MGLGKWDNLHLAVVADTVRNEGIFASGVIEVGEMAKDHEVPVEESHVTGAVVDGIGGGLLDEDGRVSVEKGMMGAVVSGSAGDKAGLGSGGRDGLDGGPELGQPDHATPLELDNGERACAAVVGDVAADVVCRGLGQAVHAVVC